MITKIKLDRLADLKAEQDLLNIKKMELIDGILTPEIKAQIAAIEEEFEPGFEAIDNNISDLSKAIKLEVIGLGETVRGDHLQAVWSKARISWDTKGLDGYMVAHPELKQFKKIGNPSVSIRKVK